jgi:hypothetical protein
MLENIEVSRVKRFAANTAGRDFAVGDIHGHFTRLQAALDAAGFDPAVEAGAEQLHVVAQPNSGRRRLRGCRYPRDGGRAHPAASAGSPRQRLSHRYHRMDGRALHAA